ncbi:pre-mRNA splicing factor ATP-dependent RNA helicase prp16 [Piedraia hortae CBS 480.64]|uniref:Pre-mRNA-splicing factor ATP-dependent RNA helicase PRP16 n=1 Tax=Piedraia hortae CBS 480.64 TaxID=1314780 RepID=A0A6A7C7N6_9PEZI|nr:pre-mRNA splicing factor ATP-dependent RNA helicase prp16 [Piedraia hortae CBS 480.64]
MLASNVAQLKEAGGFDVDETEDVRVHVLVHDLKPPFLEGKRDFTRQKDPISAVKDPKSDMAVFARRGSNVVKERRVVKERKRQAKEATGIVGTVLGDIVGAREEVKGKEVEVEMEKGMELVKEAQSEFSRTRSLKKQREFLPAFAVREEILRVIRENQVTVVVGQTGSGKTTQLTQFLYEDGYARDGQLIGCTQPRRVAAMSVAKRVAEEMEVPLGSTVGYAIRFEDCTSKSTAIKYMTDGVLLRESLTNSDLDQYSCIIMDEAHERALNTDVLMGLIKKVLARRRDLKLIVTSATMNSERFSRFYGGAPEFTIPGRTFPVDIQYSRSPCEDYVDAAVRQTLAIHVSQPAGDILVFMTGQEDIEVTCELLHERLAALNEPPPLLVLPIYSQMPADLQSKIFDRAPAGVRKVIVATNIAETSLTVDGIMYVVDSGFSKLKVFNPRMGMDTLQITPISQANAAQRAGRAGRTGPGRAFHLFTERAMREELYQSPIPEIQRTNLSNTVLLLKSLGVKELLDFDFLDSPPQETITSSLYDLWALGALSNTGNLTPLGHQMTTFPMDPTLAKLLILSSTPEYSCSEEILTIVAMLSVPSVWYRPSNTPQSQPSPHEKFMVHDSDHLSLLLVYNAWSSAPNREKFCTQNNLHPKSLSRASEIRTQLLSIMQTQSLPLLSSGTNLEVVRKCICTGFFHQAARRKGLAGEYVNLRTSVGMRLHPTSALYNAGDPADFVVYHELVLTKREYMATVTAVEVEWLVELGRVFYGVRTPNGTVDPRPALEREGRDGGKEKTRRVKGSAVVRPLKRGRR